VCFSSMPTEPMQAFVARHHPNRMTGASPHRRDALQ
jgi:hypothetical protein